ncbi:MAG: hypothetical protein QOF90_3315, partial [Acetobacteraceae bacterium]|nr:hypothetical protein [Acetobacteraceae bacterium]
GVLKETGNLFVDSGLFVGSGGTLKLFGAAATQSSPVTVASGGLIEFGGVDAAGAVSSSSTASTTTLAISTSGTPPPHESVVFAGAGLTFTSGTVGTGTNTRDLFTVTCFAEGTHIATPDGEVAVESLAEGDVVRTASGGTRVVRWVGYRDLDLTRHIAPHLVQPIRIAAGAFGESVPSRDLRLSPDHAVLLEGMLIPAKLLRNDATIVCETECRTVTYYHIELDAHDILLAEGLQAESYLDTGNRATFTNGGQPMTLHPTFENDQKRREAESCAPFVADGRVQPQWQTLADRAETLGYVLPTLVTTTDADIHLLADGCRIDAVAVAGQVHSFMVPAGIRSLILTSRSVRPNALTPYLDDLREIGVAVHGVVMHGPAGRAEFSADHPVFSHGWHAPERSGGFIWRQTTGKGVLPVGAVDGPVIVEITVGETITYLIDDVRSNARVAA